MQSRQARFTLLGLALGVLLALLIAPQTRWLVRAQLWPSSLMSGHDDRKRHVFVQSHPDDYQLQLAGQTGDDHQTQLEYARSLVPRFPKSASLRANILRYATTSEVKLHRDEDYLIQGRPVPPAHADPQNPPPTPAQFAAFDADAAAGERLDPDNAYFPFMRAVGLFAAHRDADGLAAVQRASRRHVWREYFDDEVEGRWRTNDAVSGGREAVSATAVFASVLFPHYAGLRAAARVVAYKAILEEQAGHPEAGLALRRSLGRCGELMGVQSTVLIGNLVGVAISAIARGRPGGAPPLTSDSGLSNDQRASQRLTLYCAYVAKIGHPEAAVEARADYETWQQIHQITSKIGDYGMGSRVVDLMHLAAALASGWVLLLNILTVFLLGLAARALSRLPRVEQRRPLPAGVTAGFWSVPLLALLLAALFFDAGPTDFSAYADSVLLILLVVTVLVTVRVRGVRRPLAVGLLTAGLTLGALGLFAALASWQMHGGAEMVTSFQQMFSEPTNDPEAGTLLWYNSALGQTVLGAALALAIPLLLAIVVSIVSRVRRVPISAGLVHGFRAAMPPLVLGLMLVYGGLTVWTVRQEARVNYGLERSLHGEGQYLAQLTGQAWPGG